VERVEAEAIYDAGREAVVEVLLRMDTQIQALTARVARQDERIAQLERRLSRSSRNSSIPPSADPPAGTPKRGKDPSGRRQGAQPGHEGRGRPLLPAWAVDRVIEHWPERCDCGHAFAPEERVAVGEPVRWQVEELPAILVTVTQHQCQRVLCPDCGERRRAELPSEITQSAFGPRLQAAVATLSVRNRISRRDVVECCEQLFSCRISTGTVEAILDRAAQALAKPHADLLGRLRESSAVNMDETGRDRLADRRGAPRAVGHLR
jgi:transposase